MESRGQFHKRDELGADEGIRNKKEEARFRVRSITKATKDMQGLCNKLTAE